MAGQCMEGDSSDDKLAMAVDAAARFDYVRFTVADIHGVSRSKVVKKKFFQKYFEEGVTIFEGTIGLGLAGEIYMNELVPHYPNTGNVAIIPVRGTLHDVACAGAGRYKVGEVLGEMRHMSDGTWQQACPRYVARKQLSKLKEVGYQLYSGFEVEFLMMDEETLKPAFNHSAGVFHNPSFTKNEDVLFSIDQSLEAMGVDVEIMQTEYSPGQFEFVLSPQHGITSADNMFLLRDCAKEVVAKQGKRAVFMSKPFPTLPAGNGLHFSFSLKDSKGHNPFSDLSNKDGLSDVLYYFLAGVIKHSRALTALFCPTVNCFRRVNRPAGWTACYGDWGIDDRSVAFRVKNSKPSSTYIECRIPSASANPYLVLAGIVASGVDGITSKLSCQKASTYKANGILEITKDMIKLPSTLQEALQALKEDVYLIDALGEEVIHWFSVIKTHEVEGLKNSDVMKDDDAAENFKKECDMYMHVL